MNAACTHCNDTGSLSKDLHGSLDCPACLVATERAQLEQWAVRSGIRCNDIASLYLIYRHGKQAARNA